MGENLMDKKPWEEEYSAPSVNPWEEDYSIKKETPEDTDFGSKAFSTAAGATQGITFGLADELYAGINKIPGVQRASEYLTDKLAGTDTPYQEKSYQQLRDEARGTYAQAQAENPKAYMAGEIGGGIATSLVPAGAATLPARLARAGVEGAAYGLGQSEADLTEGQIGKAAWDTAKGGMIGGLAGGVGEVAGKGLSKIGGYLKNPETYEQLAQKGTAQRLKISPSDASNMKFAPVRLPNGETSTVAQELPKFLKEEGFRPLTTLEELSDKIGQVKNKAMGDINSVSKSFDSEMDKMLQIGETTLTKGDELQHVLKIPTEAINLKQKIAYKPAESFGPKVEEILDGIRGVPGYQGQVSRISKLNEELAALAGPDGISSLDKLQGIRQKIDALIKDHAESPIKMSSYQKTLQELRRDIAEHIREKMLPEFDILRKKLAPNNPDLVSLRDKLLNGNYKMTMASNAEDLITKGMGREAKNRVVSLTDMIATDMFVGAAGGALGGLQGAALAYGAKKGLDFAGSRARQFAPEIADKTGIRLMGSSMEKSAPMTNAIRPVNIQQNTKTEDSYESMKNDPKYGPLLQDPNKAKINHYLLMSRDPEYQRRILGEK